MNIPDALFYTRTHEWVRAEPDGLFTLGITDHAQESLGELVFVELPRVGSEVQPGKACTVVESTKAAADVFPPFAGTIVAINTVLAETPERVNQDPYATWLFRLQAAVPPDLSTLLDASAYRKAFA